MAKVMGFGVLAVLATIAATLLVGLTWFWGPLAGAIGLAYLAAGKPKVCEANFKVKRGWD